MNTSDERLGRALRELDVPFHGPDFYSRLAERLDQEPTHRRPRRHRPGWIRPPMLLSLGAIAAAVVAVMAMSSMFSGDRPDVQVEAGGGTIPATTSVPTPTVRQLQPAAITASAVADPAPDACGQQVTYQPENAFDGDPITAWRPPESQAAGHFLDVEFANDVTVTRVGLVPGYAKRDPCSGRDYFITNRRILTAEWRFDNGETVLQTFRIDNASLQFIDLPAVRSRHVKVTIREVTSHNGLDFAAVSDLQVFGS